MFFDALERLQSIAVRHRGKQYSPEGMTHLIRMQFRDPGLRFTTERDDNIKSGEWSIKGEYRLYEDEQGNPSIHISLVYPNYGLFFSGNFSTLRKLCLFPLCFGNEWHRTPIFQCRKL